MKQARQDWREHHHVKAITGFIRRHWPAFAFVICFSMLGVGVMQVRDLGEQNREAIRVSCKLLNQAIDQSSEGAAGRSTVLLIEEIVEGMTPPERRAYVKAAANGVAEGAQKNPCRRVAANAY